MRTGRPFAGRFLLEEQIGRGASGTVYRAVDGDTGDDVAIKILSGTEPEHLARFEREAEVLAQLCHPHIVRYLAHGYGSDGAPYLAMEWIDGVTLRRTLADAGVSLRETVAIARAVAAGLAAAHALGVVHRDIKPANLLLEGGDVGRLKIIDFGIARRIDDDIRLTVTGHTVGTPGYMAPEQARGMRTLGHRVDLFALGCVIYECAAGAPAFVGEHATALLAKIVLGEPEPLSSRVAGLPPVLIELVARLLAKAPDARPADAAEVDAILASLGELADSPRQRALLVDEPTQLMDCSPTDRATPGSVVVVVGRPTADDDHPEIARDVAGVDARIERTAVGWTITVFAGDVPEAVRRAVALALNLRQRILSAPIALAAGERLDELLDRTARLLDGAREDGAGGIRIDDATEVWLPDGVEVVREGNCLVLRVPNHGPSGS